MATISVSLPLRFGEQLGYSMLSEYKDVVKQNLKHLFMTIPGERIMLPNFGIGISTFLFENQGEEVENELYSKIHEQVSEYMDYLEIKNVEYSYGENSFFIRVNYFIKPFSESDQLELNIVK